MYPAPLIASKRPLLVVVRNDVLPQLRPHRFQQITEVPDDRKVFKNGVLALRQVINDDNNNEPNDAVENPVRVHAKAGG